MNSVSINPASWNALNREEVATTISPTLEEKTLDAVENAIQLLQMMQMGHKLNQDELRLCQTQLRYVRVELLKK